MGKNRTKNKKSQYPQFKEGPPSPDLIKMMKKWQDSPDGSPDRNLLPKEFEFIKTHMENSDLDPEVPTGHLTRIEKANHFNEHDYKVGDFLDTDSEFRAFSREQDATSSYMRNYFYPRDPIVIYRTNGNVPHYNITKHTGSFKEEKESWVETGKLRIDKITHYTSKTDNMKRAIIDNLYLDIYPNEKAQYVKQYDDYGYDPTPQDVVFVDVSYVD